MLCFTHSWSKCVYVIWTYLCLVGINWHPWCVFVRASLHMRREEKPTRCHWMLYCTYNMLNTFRALLCPSSGARDYMCVIIAAYDVQCLVAGCLGSGTGQQAMRPGRGMLHSWVMQHSLLPCTWPPTTNNQALHTTGGNNTHSLELLMMGLEVPKTCWAFYECNKPFSGT